jgi:hypothetical protein
MSDEEQQTQEGRGNGAAAAIALSAGIGCAVMGLMVVLSEASKGVGKALDWWDPAGNLTGKTGVAIIAWLVSFGVLYGLWGKRNVAFARVWVAALVLVAAGFAFTFPPIFDLFKAG